MADTVFNLQLGIWMEKGKHYSLDDDANSGVSKPIQLFHVIVIGSSIRVETCDGKRAGYCLIRKPNSKVYPDFSKVIPN
jgi:hypothetical protein